MLLDDEVFAVLTAIVLVGSILGVALTIRGEIVVEPFTAIGLLDENCRIGDYPRYVHPNQTLNLCIFVYNHEGKPVYWKVVFKIGDNKTIPSTNVTSPNPPISEWRGMLGHGENVTMRIHITIPELGNVTKATLIFELYTYNVNIGSWEYTGRWVHLHVNVRR